MHTVSLKSGEVFMLSDGQSILSAAAKSNININYSCMTGRCSSCRCRVSSGSTRLIDEELGLTDLEKDQGWILSCVRTAESDVVLEVDQLIDAKMPPQKTLPCRINAIKQLAPDVIQVFLRLPPTSDFRFLPGQHVDVSGPYGLQRSYSLAGACSVKKELELHIRAVQSGSMSDYWFGKAKLNDLLRIIGPKGTFFLRDVAGEDLIFLATGTGIAPIKCMLESLSMREQFQRPKSVIVLWGGRCSEDLYFDLNQIDGDFLYIPVQSRPQEDWRGAKGHVQDVLLAIKRCIKESYIYACGSDIMIRSAKKLLTEAGLPENRFYSDAFVSSGKHSPI